MLNVHKNRGAKSGEGAGLWRRHRISIVGMLIACIVAVVAISLALTTGPGRVHVPSLVGALRPAAQVILSKEGLNFHIVNIRSGPGHPPKPGTVIAQSPGPGTLVSSGSAVVLNVYLANTVGS
jgi:beta-lactam-binding protein with PASTA domain